MAKKSPAKRVARLEGIVVGAGWLLQRLYEANRKELSVGLTQQIHECLRDCNQVAGSIRARAEAAAKAEAAKGGAA